MDDRLNRLCAELHSADDAVGVTMHLDEAERFFLRLPERIQVPSFPIHHQMDIETPPDTYRRSLYELIRQIAREVPGLLAGLTYHFDPRHIFHPVFLRTEEVKNTPVIVRVQFDLGISPKRHAIERAATNDKTAQYVTRDIYTDIDIVPAHRVPGAVPEIRRVINNTWIGETGRGYIAQGIWMDRDLSRFFSALVEADGRSLYPYLPFSCRFGSISHRPPAWRRSDVSRAAERLTVLHEILTPIIDDITGVLQFEAFSRSHSLFKRIRKSVPAWLREAFESVDIRAYLRDDGRKEFYIDRSA